MEPAGVPDPIEANEAFYRAFNQKDPQAMDNLWAYSVEVGCIHPGWNVLRGRQVVVESWSAILTNPHQPKIVTGGAVATVVGEVAVVVCRELVAGSPLAATNIFVLEKNQWKMIHHQSGPVSLVGQ